MKYKAVEIYGDRVFVAGDDIILAFKLYDIEGNLVENPSTFSFKAEMNSGENYSRVIVEDVEFDESIFYIIFNGNNTSDIWSGSYTVQLKVIDDTLSYVVWDDLLYLKKELINW